MSDSLRPHGLQPTRLSVHGILQARALEWGAIAFSRSITVVASKFYVISINVREPNSPTEREPTFHLNHTADSTLFCGKETSITKRLRKSENNVGEWHGGEKGKKRREGGLGKEGSGQHHAGQKSIKQAMKTT